MNHLTLDMVLIVGFSATAQVLAVWGILRHEVRGIRAEVARAHGRIDAIMEVKK